MIVIRCAQCNRKVFKYRKVGKGKVLHCWKDRITHDNSVREDMTVKCPCGAVIGVDEGKGIKMKQHAFTYSGTVTKK